MSSTPNSTVEASTTSSSPASCMASNNNAPKYGTRVPNRVFVGGLSADSTEEEMQNLFSNYGQVSSAKIISDRAGVSKGYGFITFETEEQARNLLRMTEVYLKNRKLNIAPAIKKQSQYGSGRSYDSPSPSVPSGSVYYSSGGVPYTFQNNGMSYYPAAAAAAAAAAQQEAAYNAAAANYAASQPQAQAAAAAAAASYPGYPYMYPAAAQAMYAPQQYSYQTMPPPALPAPSAMVSPVAYTNSNSSSPLLGSVAPTTNGGGPSPLSSPSLQTQTQQQQLSLPPPQTFLMTTDAAMSSNMAFPLNVPFTFMPISNGEMMVQEFTNGDVCNPDNISIPNGEDPQQISFGMGQYVIDSNCFSSPPPPLMLPVTPPPCNGDMMLCPPPMCTFVPPPLWSPLAPPPFFPSPDPQFMNKVVWNNDGGYGRRDNRQHRGGRRGGGRGRYQRISPSGDIQQQNYRSCREVPPRMNNNNNNNPPQQYKYDFSSPPTTCCPDQTSNLPLINSVPSGNKNSCFMPNELVKMVQALQINNN